MPKINQTLRCSDLKVDYSYQRPLDPKVLKKIVNEWDYILENPATVSLRKDGSYWIIDGNHTVNAKIQVFGDNATIECKVVENLSIEEEAILFCKLNSSHRNPCYNEKLKAKIASGDDTARAYEAALIESGVNYTFSRSGKMLNAHSTIFKAFRTYGKGVMLDALRIASASWKDDPTYLQGAVVAGLMYFCSNYKFSEDRAVKKLSACTVEDIKREAKRTTDNAWSGGSKDKSYGEGIVRIVNKTSKKCGETRSGSAIKKEV